MPWNVLPQSPTAHRSDENQLVMIRVMTIPELIWGNQKSLAKNQSCLVD